MTNDCDLEILMSRKDEVLKLAQLFRLQARLTKDRPTKRTLRKLGDHYQDEVKKLQEQVPVECTGLSKPE